MWELKSNSFYTFLGGKDADIKVAQIAQKCPSFTPDDEDEQVSDEPISCYNCLYRRWTKDSFECREVEINKC